MSISHIKITAGTFGAVVKKRGDTQGDCYVLSSNHVLTQFNRPEPGAAVVQPGSSDGGKAVDKIAELAEMIPLEFDDREFKNTVDAAIARVLESSDVHSDIIHLGRPAGVGGPIRRRMKVRFAAGPRGVPRGRLLIRRQGCVCVITVTFVLRAMLASPTW